MGLLENHVCVITGGAGSIGAATARVFVREGARVMLVDLHEDALQRIAAEFASERVAWTVADVTQTADVRAYVERTVERFGKVDVLFSNAGTVGAIAPIERFPEDEFDAVLAVHV